MQNFDVAAWFAAIAFICAVDALWFAFAWDNVYNFNTLFKNKPNFAIGAFYVVACAVFAATVLVSLRGASYEEAASTGALIGGLVFFVFNACACFIVNHIDGDVNTQWTPKAAMCDLFYGTAVYTAATVIIYSIAGP